MSKFLSKNYLGLKPYTPGEQPKDIRYIKLNTNESPFPPSKKTISFGKKALKKLNLYSDPEMRYLRDKAQEVFNIDKDEIMFTNGSDEILNFAFACYGDKGVAYPQISYGFYTVFASLYNLDKTEIPLKEDFSIDYKDYLNLNKLIVIANPNAPTGIIMPLWQIEEIVKNNDSVVVIDEAYIDFGGESAISLVKKYKNLIVTQTFSKSRSLAGARLGFGVADKELIKDLNTMRYSTNPYNVNSTTLAMGFGALEDNNYYLNNCKTIIANRDYLTKKLQELGFLVLPSKANFVFAKTDKIGGEELYLKLKSKGVLVRHFTTDSIKEYNRITIGTKKQLDILLNCIKQILGETL
ncbi:MAG: histidinol-phosphate transaminase [Clostridia bacterium]|nr:histidinol-phosphate transaminase [Clostridia bacterium]